MGGGGGGGSGDAAPYICVGSLQGSIARSSNGRDYPNAARSLAEAILGFEEGDFGYSGLSAVWGLGFRGLEP